MSKKYIRKHWLIIGWSADEIAECIPYQDDENHSIYKALWQAEIDGKGDQFWPTLTNEQKQAINEGAKKQLADEKKYYAEWKKRNGYNG